MYQVFISHASEDKNAVAKPLADSLISKGVNVWYDDYELKLGDSLRKSIDKGLNMSDFGIVILSPNFFKKNWPDYELNSLVTLEMAYSRKIILPIWHNVELSDVVKYSPSLGDKIAASTKKGLDYVVNQILNALEIKQAPSRSIYDLNSDKNIKLNWGIFNSASKFENLELLHLDSKPVWRINATQKEDVGINLFNLPKKGVLEFDYLISKMNLTNPNIVFYLIPIKTGGKLVEVGFDRHYDKKNAFSFYRQRIRPRMKLDEWISEKIEYNFQDLSNLEYVIFAPRINEGCAFRDNGQIMIKNVVVTK